MPGTRVIKKGLDNSFDEIEVQSEAVSTAEGTSQQVGRPFSVTLFVLGVLILTGLNINRFVQSFLHWDFLAGILPFTPLYVSLTGLFWGLVNAALAWGLWQGRLWALRFVRWAALGYIGYYWVDRLLLSGERKLQPNWPFAAGVSIGVMILIYWWFGRRKIKIFFVRS